MHIAKRVLLFVVLAIAFLIVLPEESHGWPWNRRGASARAPARPKNQNYSQRDKYGPNVKKYAAEYDYNHDGVIDGRDRVIWLETHKAGGVQNVLVSKENEDLIEIMDINNDGSVDSEEMRMFYQKYDLNNNGVLETNEINAAID